MSSAFALPYHCNRMWQPIGSTFPTSHAPVPFALHVAVSGNAVKVRFVEVSSPSRNLTDIMFCYAESHHTSVCIGVKKTQLINMIGRHYPENISTKLIQNTFHDFHFNHGIPLDEIILPSVSIQFLLT